MANEKATPRGGVYDIETLKLAHGVAVAAHEIIVVNGNVLVAINDALVAEENVYMYRGPASFPKATGVSTGIASNTKVYWDAAAGVVTTNDAAGANKQIGTTLEATTDNDADQLVMMAEN